MINTNHGHLMDHIKKIGMIANEAIINGCKTEDLLQIGMLVSYITGFFDNFNNTEKAPGNSLNGGTETEMLQLKYGDGCIAKREYKNRNGEERKYYEGRFYYKGKQYSVTASSKTKCIEKIKKLKQEKTKKEKILDVKKDFTLGEWVRQWYIVYKEADQSEKTREHIRSLFKCHLTGGIADIPLKDIKAIEIQNYLNSMTAERAREQIFNYIRAALKMAKANDMISSDIWLALSLKKHITKEKTPFTMEQIHKLLNYFNDNPIMTKVTIGYLYTGCRLSELLTITWADINEENKTVTIKGTKTKSSLRTIPLFNPLRKVLGDRQSDSEKVFNISETTIKRQYSAAFIALNFKGIYTIHSLRHTFATICDDSGINPKITASWMGHANDNVTRKVYIHKTNESEKAAIEKFETKFNIA